MKRGRLVAALAVLALITIARIVLVESLLDQGFFAKYMIFADRILAGQILRDRLLDLSPLYLWFTVALRSLGAGFHVIRGLQIVMVSIAAICVGYAARRFNPILAAAIVVASRGALVCATELEPETLILLLNAAALAVLAGGTPADRPAGRRRSIAGLLLGLSAVCRPNAILIAVLVAIALRSWRLIAAAAVPVLIVLGINVALTGEVAVMDPGTVFYEGMNPSAGGYEGVQPRIINDLERQSREPDYLHVAYREVASGASGRMLTRSESNRYWTAKAIAFIEEYPLAALNLTLRKLYFAIHSYEPYDLNTMVRKDRALAPWPIFLPFGVVVAWAAAARSRELRVPLLFAIAILATLVLFYVTARQRNAMIPAMAVLASAGVTDIVTRRRRLAAITVAVAGVLLSVNGEMQNEDAAGWLGLRNGFDRAIALENAGRWAEADAILQQIEGYRPMRENRAVSSVAYYRARAGMHLGQPKSAVSLYADQAEREAPGNEHVLALRAALGDQRAMELLVDLHDPFTARRALVSAGVVPP